MAMDLPGLQDALERVTKKHRVASTKTVQLLDKMLLDITRTCGQLEAAGRNHMEILAELDSKFQQLAPMEELGTVQKELNASISKCGKIVEKNFCNDIAKAWREGEFDSNVLNLIIVQHFYRQGCFDVGDAFCEEAGVQPTDALRSEFFEMHNIVQQIRLRNLEPALAWAKANREQLTKQDNNHTFEFKLHQLHFVLLLHRHERTSALTYARANFAAFGQSHFSAIQRLMGCLLYFDRLEASPYKDLLAPSQWENVEDEFVRQCCAVLDRPILSPLQVALTAGAHALPSLLKLATLMGNKKPNSWQQMEQLPVEIELGKGFHFHSIFACPVSREQSSTDNPPMLLPCGHVLCNLSIQRLGKSNSRSFKCPYCPIETNQTQCRPIHF